MSTVEENNLQRINEMSSEYESYELMSNGICIHTDEDDYTTEYASVEEAMTELTHRIENQLKGK